MGIADMKTKKSPCKKKKPRARKMQDTPWREKFKREDVENRLTEEMARRVEHIMSLPYEKRRHAGAKDWNFCERAYAKRIELRRIRDDLSWCGMRFEEF